VRAGVAMLAVDRVDVAKRASDEAAHQHGPEVIVAVDPAPWQLGVL
jgi:hypothetical protein